MKSPSESFNTLLTGAGAVLIGTVIGRLLALLGQVFIVRSLTPETFGHIALAYTVALVATRIGMLGIPEGVVRFVSSRNGSHGGFDVLRSGILLALCGGVVSAAIVLVLRFELSAAMNDTELPGLLLYFVPYFLAYPVAQTVISGLRSRKRAVRATLTRDLVPYIGSLLVFGYLATAGLAEIGAVLYWVTVPAFMIVLGAYYLHKDFRVGKLLSAAPDTLTLRELWSFSWPLAVTGSFTMLLSHLDVLMIGYFLSAGSVGQYRAIQPLQQVTGFVLSAFVFLYYPLATEYFSAGAFGELNSLYSVSTKWIVAATFPPVLVLTFFSPDVVRVFFGPSYLPAAPALSVLVFGLFFRSLVGPSGSTVKAIDRPRVELLGSLSAVVINVLLNVLLIPRFGIVGAAVATAAGFFVFNGIEVLFVFRTTGGHPFARNNLKPLVPSLAVTVLLAYGLREQTLGLLVLVLLGVFLTAVYLISFLITGCLEEEDLVILEQLRDKTGLRLVGVERFIRKWE